MKFLYLQLILLPTVLGFYLPEKNPYFEAIKNDLPPECLERNQIDVDVVLKELQDCIEGVFNPLVSGAFRDGRFLDPFVEALCDKADLMVCFVKAEDKLKPCLSKEKQAYFEYTLRSMAAAIIYGCKKGGEAFKALFSKKGSVCMFKAQPHFPHCQKMLPHPVENKTLDFWFRDEHCKKQGDFARCIVHVFEWQCENDGTSHVIHGLFLSMFHDTPCERYYGSATRVGFGLAGLIITVVAMIIK